MGLMLFLGATVRIVGGFTDLQSQKKQQFGAVFVGYALVIAVEFPIDFLWSDL